VKYKETTRSQWDAAAKAWNDYGVFLRQWLGPATEIMIDMAGIAPGSHVLDVAAGAGDQTLTIARAVGPKGHVLATDLSSSILEFAKMNAHRAGHDNVETRVMDGENLDLPEDSCDAIVCRLGLFFFPHQEQALKGFRRVLKQDGKAGLIVFTTPENNPFFSIPISIIRRRASLPPLTQGQPGPFSLGAPRVLENLLKKTGFRNIEVKTVLAPLRMASADDCVRFEQESFGALHAMLKNLDEKQKTEAWQEIRSQLKQYESGPNRFECPCELLIVAGTK
jgi:ubiquinone/menaquinone biosynthesis C-methylase UbiE